MGERPLTPAHSKLLRCDPAGKRESARDPHIGTLVMSSLSETGTLDAVHDPTRLALVRETGLLDSPAEEAFDRLTRLAAKLTGAPVTFISLVDEERDFYKSCFGFPEPLASERQLTGTTFCHYALVSRGPLVIEDTLAHPIYRNVPTVQSLGVRAYLGIPLRFGGRAIGSFCAIDFSPRAWSSLEIEVMEELAASTMREIELRAAMEAAEMERGRLKTLLMHVPAAVIFADGASRRVLLWNQRVEEILGTVPRGAEIERDESFAAFHPDGRIVGAHESPLERAILGETVHGEEFRIERSDGTAVWIRVHGAPVRDAAGEAIIGGVISFYDVTEQRRIGEENRSLYEQARSANRAQDDFFATVSHELRSPMTSILGWSKLLMGEDLQNETAREAAEAIAGSARLQAQLIDDLLDASRISTGKVALAMNRLNVNDSISEAVRAAQPVAASHGLRLRANLSEVPVIEGDAARLRQVVSNLLSNSIKFTPPGGLIEVSSRTENERAVIVVSDTGRGIAPELLPHIFEKHRQARTGELGGLGLGLTIVRHLVEMHGGEVRAHSAGPGKGTEFTIRL
jgi:PAS domain S-box-containing protein